MTFLKQPQIVYTLSLSDFALLQTGVWVVVNTIGLFSVEAKIVDEVWARGLKILRLILYNI